MDSDQHCIKYLKVKDIQKVIDAIGNLIESSFNSKSLSLVISKTGEATFTSSAWKLLSEAGFSHPLTKVIVNAAMNYTTLCGDDCKYFIFILREIFRFMVNKLDGNDEVLIRRILRDEICSLKELLPCIFYNVCDVTNCYPPDSELNSFFKDLHNVVFTFMSSRFSVSTSEILTKLITDFINKISSDSKISLKIVLDYVISHFDIFCCKMIGHLEESRVMEGFILYMNGILQKINLQNVKFVVIFDLAMKVEAEHVAWKISDESFPLHLNECYSYEKIFDYFKSQDIFLLLTPSVCKNQIKISCEKYGIFVVDRLDRKEVEYLLFCLQLNALENLNESLDSKNVGNLNFAKSLSFNKSQFLQISCVSQMPILSAHHIFLHAPSHVMWKEYYSECLSCFRMIDIWLKSGFKNCTQEGILKVPESNLNPCLRHSASESKTCDLCSELRLTSKENCRKVLHLDALESLVKGKFLLAPGVWELVFKNILQRVPEKSKYTCNIALQALMFAVERSLYKKIGVLINKDMNSEIVHSKILAKCKLGDFNLLQPVVCNQIMISHCLDLLMQLLKIECIVLQK